MDGLDDLISHPSQQRDLAQSAYNFGLPELDENPFAELQSSSRFVSPFQSNPPSPPTHHDTDTVDHVVVSPISSEHSHSHSHGWANLSSPDTPVAPHDRPHTPDNTELPPDAQSTPKLQPSTSANFSDLLGTNRDYRERPEQTPWTPEPLLKPNSPPRTVVVPPLQQQQRLPFSPIDDSITPVLRSTSMDSIPESDRASTTTLGPNSIKTVGIDSENTSLMEHSDSAQSAVPAQQVDLVEPVDLQNGTDNKPTFVITVGDPQKVGDPVTAHTVYTVRTKTSSTAYRKNDFSVLRRYNDFLWLHDALVINNPGVIVPPPPSKSALGRFSSDFVESRRLGLQTCLQKIVDHPLLYSDPDLRTFLESDTFNIDIKHRKLETPTTDKGGFLTSLTESLSLRGFVENDEFFPSRKTYIDSLEPQLKSVHAALHAAAKQRMNTSQSLAELATALVTLKECEALSVGVREAVDGLVVCVKILRDAMEQQAKAEEGGLVNIADAYLRSMGAVRQTFSARVKAHQTMQRAEAHYKSVQQAHDKAKRQNRPHAEVSQQELSEVQRRAQDAQRDFDDISKLIKSECHRFDAEKVEDFKGAVQAFVEKMYSRQLEIVKAWEDFQEIVSRAINTQPTAEPPPPTAKPATEEPETSTQKNGNDTNDTRDEIPKPLEENGLSSDHDVWS